MKPLMKPYFRSETCMQIALAIKEEVEDLEAAGIQVNLENWLCLIPYPILSFYFLFTSIYLLFMKLFLLLIPGHPN
jgi:hypothetical protein